MQKQTLNKNEFAGIKQELAKSEQSRELLIQHSREIIRLSKQIIYAIQRDDLKDAEALTKKIRQKVKSLPPEDCSTGMKNVAMQEYGEAMSLLSFVKSGTIPTRAELGISTEDYLAALSDLTGELVRMAVNTAIRKKNDDVFRICDLISEVYEQFLQLDFRNGELRKKSDQIKWNLQKLQDMVYDILKTSKK